MNSYFFLATVLFLVATALGDRISDGVLSIAIGIGVACTIVGLLQMNGLKGKTRVNGYFYLATVLILVATALGDRISDGVLSIAIGIGVACIIVGLFQMNGKKSKGPPFDQ